MNYQKMIRADTRLVAQVHKKLGRCEISQGYWGILLAFILWFAIMQVNLIFSSEYALCTHLFKVFLTLLHALRAI